MSNRHDRNWFFLSPDQPEFREWQAKLVSSVEEAQEQWRRSMERFGRECEFLSGGLGDNSVQKVLMEDSEEFARIVREMEKLGSDVKFREPMASWLERLKDAESEFAAEAAASQAGGAGGDQKAVAGDLEIPDEIHGPATRYRGIERPPGLRTLGIVKWLSSKEAWQQVFEPLIADFHHEFFEAVRASDSRQERRVQRQYQLALWRTSLAHVMTSLWRLGSRCLPYLLRMSDVFRFLGD